MACYRPVADFPRDCAFIFPEDFGYFGNWFVVTQTSRNNGAFMVSQMLEFSRHGTLLSAARQKEVWLLFTGFNLLYICCEYDLEKPLPTRFFVGNISGQLIATYPLVRLIATIAHDRGVHLLWEST
jgi:hypothetical protein